MSFLHFYLCHRQAIIPTVVSTMEGVYIDTEPVTVIDIDDLDLLRQALLAAVEQENRCIPMPEGVMEPGSVVLEKVGMRRWEEFERQSVLYTIHCSSKAISAYMTGRGADGLWRELPENRRVFPVETALAHVIDSILEDVLRECEMNRLKQSPLLLPPPPSN